MLDMYKNHRWRPTNAPTVARRMDDIWFLDENRGWAVTWNGKIIATTDGGDSWTEQASFDGIYMRCIGFANDQIGWVGTFDPAMRLLHTTDGGAIWNNVTNLPGPDPEWICGLYVVNENVVYAAGANDQTKRAAIFKTTDGGANWISIDMDAHAASLIDIYFEDKNSGWVVGGVDSVKHPGRASVRGDLVPGIFRTLDGGATWTNLIEGPEYVSPRRGIFPQGEWCWKIQVLDDQTIVVSDQNYRDGAILRSDDGGETWERLRLNDRQRNSNLEGIGFLNATRGWVGGWGDLRYQGGFSSESTDGGENWLDANQVGFRINRFRMIGSPPTVVYASGDTVYKFTDDPLPPTDALSHALDVSNATIAGADCVNIPVDIPQGAERVTVRIWERDGRFVRLLLDEPSPKFGPRILNWDFSNDAGDVEEAGGFNLRISIDGTSRSYLVLRQPGPN